MTLVSFPLRLPADLKDAAARQAAEAGVSLNHYISTALAVRVGGQEELARLFAMRASRTSPERGLAILEKAGAPGHVRPDDRLDADNAP